MMTRCYGWALCLLAVAGCKPMQLVSSSKVSTTSPPIQSTGPLVEMQVTPVHQPGGKVAIVDVDGVLLNMDMTGFYSLGENPVSVFREKLDRIAASGCYCAVVLRINSPGGGVTASDIMWRDLAAFKARTGLPVVACLMDVGTGGAYYLATASDQIVAHPTTITGGMGVILNVYNLQDTMAQFNILAAPIKAGRNIDMGTPIHPPTEEQLAILKDVANQFHARFRYVVTRGRPNYIPAEPDFDGRVLTATQAQQRGLVDQIGYLDDAIQVGRELAGCPQAVAVMLHRCDDRARTPYAITPNTPIQNSILPLNIPGLSRAQMPTFLYLWQAETSLDRWGGR